ncbi:MAG: TetR/AcrR family transcriptional regulator [Actinobacteria bacterium]|nr:TetR/AcrR family transcriptional regulator [Actinomycetota bacterium]
MYPLGRLSSRERIKMAARRELSDSGILGLRMEVVAEKAEVSVPLIYKYYRNRDGLLTEVLSELYDGDSYANLAAYADVFEQMENPTVDDIAILFANLQQGFRRLDRWKRLQILAASAEIPELHTRLAAIHLEQQQRVVDFLEIAIRAVASKNPGSTEESISAAVALAPPLASLIKTQSLGSVLDDLVDYEDREAAAEDMKVLLRLIIDAVLSAGKKSS